MLTTSGLSQQIQDISKKKACKDPSYPFSSTPLVSSDDWLLGYPFIDQVKYREWNEEIIFSETSTVFFRVEGRIKWYKSKQNNNQNNPIFINGDINTNWWEPVNDSAEYKTFREVFVATEGQVEYTLPYTPDAVLLVSINGQGPLSNINGSDYDVVGDTITLKAPNLPSIGDEIVVIASYDADEIINNPVNTVFSTNEEFTFGGNYAFNLTRIPLYVRSVTVNGYSLGTDLFSYSTSNTAVLVLVDAPEFVLNTGDKVFIEYDYREI